MDIALVVGINAVALALLFIILSRRVDRRFRDEVALEPIRRELSELVAELNDVGDRNVSVIEDRIARLDALIGDADKRIRVLSGLLQPKPTPTYESLATLAHPSEGADKERVATDSPADDGTSFASPRERVLSLHRQGLSAEVIADRTGASVGEVELMIGLGETHR